MSTRASPRARCPLPPRTPFVLAALLLALQADGAGELLSGRLYTVPERPYVNQPFELHFELEVSPGSEVEDLRVSDFPNDPDVLALSRLETSSRTRSTRDGQSVDVLHFLASGRGHFAVEHTFNPTLQCTLVQRRSAGFFSQWQSYPRQLRLAPFGLCIRPLPTAGRPASFSGAVGQFRLTGALSRSAVRPGDIVTLTLELSGTGWLGDARLPFPEPSALFKCYPAKETLREPLRVKAEQVLIPQATNATEIAAVTFSFFNPATDAYQACSAGPFPLTFTSQDAAPKAAEVLVINSPSAAAQHVPSAAISVEVVNQRFRHLLPLLTFCAAALLAGFAVAQLYARHARLALAVGLVLLAAGGAASRYAFSRSADGLRTVSQRAEARFAPSLTAVPLFVVQPAAKVTPLESAGDWVRVDAAGGRGWIPAAALGAKADTPK